MNVPGRGADSGSCRVAGFSERWLPHFSYVLSWKKVWSWSPIGGQRFRPFFFCKGNYVLFAFVVVRVRVRNRVRKRVRVSVRVRVRVRVRFRVRFRVRKKGTKSLSPN